MTGADVKQIRKRLGLTLEQLGKEYGCSLVQAWRIEALDNLSEPMEKKVRGALGRLAIKRGQQFREAELAILSEGKD